MVDIPNRRRREKGKSRVSFSADQSAILMSLCCGNSHCMDGQFVKGKELSLSMKGEFFVASIFSGGNVPAYFTATSMFMAIKLLYEPLVYSNKPLSLLFFFSFKIGK